MSKILELYIITTNPNLIELYKNVCYMYKCLKSLQILVLGTNNICIDIVLYLFIKRIMSLYFGYFIKLVPIYLW